MRNAMKRYVGVGVLVASSVIAGSAFGGCPMTYKQITSEGVMYCVLNLSATKSSCEYICNLKTI
jgi:hypothetical protein